MIHLSIVVWARVHALFAIARSAVCLSRILLLVVAVELITMPVTQGLWTWDRFLHGGQDFELGLLIIITCLCLILLRAEQSRRYLGLLVEALSLTTRRRVAISLFTCSLSSDRGLRCRLRFRATSFNRPLLI